MKKYQPKQVNKALSKLEDNYHDSLKNYVSEIMQNKIKPYLVKNQLSFTVMNGFPHVYDCQGLRRETPKIILDMWEVFHDINGCPIGYCLDDFKYQEIDFNQCDIDSFNRRVSKMTSNECALSMIMAGV